MERIINTQLIDYLLSNKLISKHQHGFLKKHSTCTNLLETVNDWTLALDNRLKTDTIYIDFKKAFDSVSHPKLRAKLQSYNISGDLLDWIAAFLDHRSQQVIISNCLSDTVLITSGVPQGSVLGPTLFLLYINDLSDGFKTSSCTLKLYADDVKLYSSYQIGEYSIPLVQAINYLTEWSTAWQLQIAYNKCVAHKIATLNTTVNYHYEINGNKLEWSSCTRDLGIYMDNDLKFTQHISKIVHTGHSRANLILKCFITRDSDVLIKAFCTYVRPVLEYCSQVWSPHHAGLVNKIEQVQRRFTKKLAGLSNLTYNDRLTVLNLQPLELRRIKLDLIMCYKIINGLVAIDSSYMFVASRNTSTRGHIDKLFIQRSRLDVRKFTFASRICPIWNSLSPDIVNATTVISFKKKLTTHNFDLYIHD
jgi:hypothetical protein